MKVTVPEVIFDLLVLRATPIIKMTALKSIGILPGLKQVSEPSFKLIVLRLVQLETKFDLCDM